MPPPSPIRVCLPILYYPPEFGGHGIQIQRNLPLLEERGIRVTVLAQHLPDGLREDDSRVARELSRYSEPLAAFRKVVQLRRFFRRHRREFDLVHTVLTGWELMLNVPYLRSLGLPIVYEMILGNEPSAMRRTRAGRLKVHLMRDVDAWIGLSRTFLPRVRAAGIPEERFRVVYGGVDTDRYRPRPDAERAALRNRLDIPSHARVVLSAGSIIRRKGMDRAVEAWAALGPEAGRDLLVLAGPDGSGGSFAPDEAAFVAQLRERIERPDLAGTVRLTGRVSNLEEYMAAADVFLFLSRKEGLGYVTIEAMSSGLPAVVSPMDGIGPELVQEGRTGHVAPEPDDAAAVADVLRKVLGDPDMRARFGEAGRERVLERFSMEARTDALETLYRELLDARKGESSSRAR
jgi:glycosyltransferase involved in cell wall biosynthesis